MNKDLCNNPACSNYGRYNRYCHHAAVIVPEKTVIAKKSENQKELDKKFAKAKRKYLQEHLFCEAQIEGECQKVSIDVHHKKGKATEELLLDPKFFLACCRKCHDIIEANPKWAKQMGFSLSRLAKISK